MLKQPVGQKRLTNVAVVSRLAGLVEDRWIGWLIDGLLVAEQQKWPKVFFVCWCWGLRMALYVGKKVLTWPKALFSEERFLRSEFYCEQKPAADSGCDQSLFHSWCAMLVSDRFRVGCEFLMFFGWFPGFKIVFFVGIYDLISSIFLIDGFRVLW